VVPYNPDLGQVLAALRKRVFDNQEYYLLPDDDGWPTTMDELWADEEVQYSGTHSILDIATVIGPDDPDGYGTLRPLRRDELLRYFGTVEPSRATFDHAYARRDDDALITHGQRWSGYSTTLHDRRTPTEIAIWGFSGD
jgi:hypothetical protein